MTDGGEDVFPQLVADVWALNTTAMQVEVALKQTEILSNDVDLSKRRLMSLRNEREHILKEISEAELEVQKLESELHAKDEDK